MRPRTRFLYHSHYESKERTRDNEHGLCRQDTRKKDARVDGDALAEIITEEVHLLLLLLLLLFPLTPLDLSVRRSVRRDG